MQMQPLYLHGFERLWQIMHKIRHFTDALVCPKSRTKAPTPQDTTLFYTLDLYRFYICGYGLGIFPPHKGKLIADDMQRTAQRLGV